MEHDPIGELTRAPRRDEAAEDVAAGSQARARGSDAQIEPELRRTAPSSPAVEKRRVGSRIALGLVVLVVGLLGWYLIVRLSSPRPAGNAAPNAQAAPQPVGAATIGRGNVQVSINALGTVTPVATVTVQTQINGQLQDVAFAQGQMVKKGDFLAQIDPRPYQLLQAQYEGQLAHDQGVLQQAQTDLARYRKLAEQNSIAKQQYEDQVYIVQQDEGTVKIDRALIDQQKLNVTYCHIVSPITGRVGLRLVDPGNYVQATNNTGLAVITQVQPITVIFPIPEDELPNVLPQLTAGTPMEVQVYDRADVRLLATGRVEALDSQIDATTGMVKLRARFSNADNLLFPNQFVNVRLMVRTLRDVVTVPNAAIQSGPRGTYVYVINANDTVSVRSVTIGPTNGPLAAVRSGLSAGERVVVDGTDHLRDGARVTISPPPSSASSANANTAPGVPAPNGRNPGGGNSPKPGP